MTHGGTERRSTGVDKKNPPGNKNLILPKQKTTWQFFVPFSGWLSDPFRCESWPPTMSNKKVTAWITACSTMEVAIGQKESMDQFEEIGALFIPRKWPSGWWLSHPFENYTREIRSFPLRIKGKIDKNPWTTTQSHCKGPNFHPIFPLANGQGSCFFFSLHWLELYRDNKSCIKGNNYIYRQFFFLGGIS